MIYHGLLALLVSMAGMAHCYPSGAPPEACGTLNPTSHGPSTAKGAPPYKLTIGASSYTPNQKIEVTLAGVGSAMFKGFLVEAMSASNGKTDPLGQFTNTSTSQVACGSGQTGNGITHVDATPKSSQTFVWQAPASNVGGIIFHYTVVRGGAPSTTPDPADYFMDIKSLALSPAETVPFTRINLV